MNLKKYTDTMHELKSKAVSQNIVVIVLSITLLIMAFKLQQQDVTTVLPPPNYVEEIRVSGGLANSAYAKGWAMHFSSLLGNVTPQNADFVADSVLSYMTPQVQLNTKAQVGQAIKSLKEMDASVSFVATSVSYEPKTKRTFVTGKVRTYKTPVGVQIKKEEPVIVTFEYVIGISEGMPVIKHFTRYKGNPKTFKELFHEERKQKALNEQKGA